MTDLKKLKSNQSVSQSINQSMLESDVQLPFSPMSTVNQVTYSNGCWRSKRAVPAIQSYSMEDFAWRKTKNTDSKAGNNWRCYSVQYFAAAAAVAAAAAAVAAAAAADNLTADAAAAAAVVVVVVGQVKK